MSNRMKWLGFLAVALCLSLPLLNRIMEIAYNEQGTGVFVWYLSIVISGIFVLAILSTGRGRKLSDADTDVMRWDRHI